MIVTTQVHHCPNCHSPNIVKNGHTCYGAQRGLCHDCGKTRVLFRRRHRDPEKQAMIDRALRERLSLRGICRIFRVSLDRLLERIATLVAQLPSLQETLVSAQPDDVLELDELYSFVGKKKNKRWLWVALCRRTRQVVAFVIGDRSERTCRRLYRRLPQAYRHCGSYSDFWAAYAKVFQRGRHQSVDKRSGQTAHVERWNCTLRQRVSRYVRRSLAFSKVDRNHYLFTENFIVHYNLELINT